MNNSTDPDKMAAAQRPGEVATPRHQVRHASRGKEREVFCDNPLGLTGPPRPYGAGRASGERCGTLAEEVVNQLALLIVEANDRNNGTT